MTTNIVSAYVSHNQTRASELPDLIAAVHASLAKVGAPQPAQEPEPELKPAVSIKKSITDDYLVCLDDGRQFKSLRRHLAQLGMSPNEYRAKWGLPYDYPMVAPSYAAKRSELAKAIGLGNQKGTPRSRNISHSPPALAEPLQIADESLTPAEAETRATAPSEARVEPDTPAEANPPKRRGRPKKAV